MPAVTIHCQRRGTYKACMSPFHFILFYSLFILFFFLISTVHPEEEEEEEEEKLKKERRKKKKKKKKKKQLGEATAKQHIRITIE